MTIRIKGTGVCIPEKVVTNADLEKMVDTSDEWITSRTGIKERRMAAPGESTSDLACRAAESAIADAGLTKDDISGVILTTISPDYIFPSTACIVQAKLGLKNVFAFDISAACTGFIYGLKLADGLIASGGYDNVLVISSDTLSRFTDYTDRATCVLFGDGAGAAVVSKAQGGGPGVRSIYISADGSAARLIYVPGGGSKMPATAKTVEERQHFIKMEGNELFKKAVFGMIESSEKSLEMAGIKSESLKLLIPHQANMRIIRAVQKRLELPDEKVYVNIDRYGNMSAATVIVALHETLKKGLLKKGDLTQLVAFGSGLTWGAAVIQI